MRNGTEEEDFRRYRDEGDIEAMGRVFDALAPKLLIVAGHLVRDAGAAEDLVQTTFVTALEKAQRWDDSRALVPWLCGILSHRARDLVRRQRVRSAHQLDEAEVELDPSELAVNRELQVAIAAALDGLGEPYREVLILRVVHGLAPTEIAHTLGRAPGTVRVQLARGRERLRDALPRGSLLPVCFLVDDGAGLAGVRDSVLSEASMLLRAGQAAGVATATSVPLVFGGWFSMKLAWFATAGISMGVLVWALFAGDDARGMEETTARAEAGPPAALVPLPSSALAPAEVASERAPLPEARADSRETEAPRLAVRLTFEVDDAPAADVGVYLRPVDGADLGLELRTDAEGRAVFEELDAGRYRLTLDRIEQLREVDVSAPRTLAWSIPRGVDVHGTVVDLEGNGVGGAELYRIEHDHHDHLIHIATADPLGAFVVRDADPTSSFLARAPGYQPSSTRRGSRGDSVDGERGHPVRMKLVLGALGNPLTGRVLDPDGRGVPWALVAVAVDEDARRSPTGVPGRDRGVDRRKAPDLEAFFVRADADGAFHTNEVPAGTATLFARPMEMGELVAWAVVDVVNGRSTDLELVLERGAEIFGRVTTEGGEPASDVQVVCEWEGNDELGQTEGYLGGFLADIETHTDADGRYRLVGLLPGEYDVELEAAYGERPQRDDVELIARQRHEWNPVLSGRGLLALRLVDAKGQGLAGWGVGVGVQQDRMDSSAVLAAATDADGRYRLAGIPLREHWVTVHPPGDLRDPSRLDRSIPVPVHAELLAPSEDEQLIRLDPLPSASLRGRIQSVDGLPLRSVSGRHERNAAVRLAFADFDNFGRQTVDDDGGFAFGPLAAGEYTLYLEATGVPATCALGTFVLSPGQELDLGLLTPPVSARLELVIATENRTPLPDFELDVRVDGDRLRMKRLGESGEFHSEPADAGACVVTVRGPEFAPLALSFPLARGGSERRQILLSPGVEQLFELVFTREPTTSVRKNCESHQGRFDLSIYDVDGHTLVWEREDVEYLDLEGKRLRYARRLLPGRYRAVFEDERYDGWDKPKVAVDFEVTEAPEPVLIELR